MRHVGGREHPGSQRRRCGGSREPAAWGQCCERTAAGPPGPPAWAERHACLAWRAPCLPAWWTAAPGKTRGRPPRPRAAPHLSAVRPLSPGGAPPRARVAADTCAGADRGPAPRPVPPRPSLAPNSTRSEGGLPSSLTLMGREPRGEAGRAHLPSHPFSQLQPGPPRISSLPGMTAFRQVAADPAALPCLLPT